MKQTPIHALVAQANLTRLAKASSINIRTLRRIKAGETKLVHPSTERLIRQALEQAEPA